MPLDLISIMTSLFIYNNFKDSTQYSCTYKFKYHSLKMQTSNWETDYKKDNRGVSLTVS